MESNRPFKRFENPTGQSHEVLFSTFNECNSGDQVEIITSETAKPTSSWLDYVITSKARSAIRTALRTEEREIADEGKELLRRKLRQMKFKFNDRIINAMVSYFKLKTSLDLYYRIGIGTIDNKMLKNYQFYDNEVKENSLVLLSISTPYDIQTETILGYKVLDKKFNVDNISKDLHVIKELDGKGARSAIFEKLNLSIDEIDSV